MMITMNVPAMFIGQTPASTGRKKEKLYVLCAEKSSCPRGPGRGSARVHVSKKHIVSEKAGAKTATRNKRNVTDNASGEIHHFESDNKSSAESATDVKKCREDG